MNGASNGLATGGIKGTLKRGGQSNNVCDDRDLEIGSDKFENMGFKIGNLTIWKPCAAYFFADSPEML